MDRSVFENRYCLRACFTGALLMACAACPYWPPNGVPHPGSHTPPPSAAGSPAAGGSGAPSSGDRSVPVLPALSGTCPTLETGDVRLAGAGVRLWIGTPQPNRAGPLVIYWHATGSSAFEVEAFWGNGRILPDILAEGGVVAALMESTGQGASSGFDTWFTGDFDVVDQLVACAYDQLKIDPRRIFTAGCSAGGLQAGALAYGRSNYIAAALMNSGGLAFPVPLQDPARVPAAITAHGPAETDVVISFVSRVAQNRTPRPVLRRPTTLGMRWTEAPCWNTKRALSQGKPTPISVSHCSRGESAIPKRPLATGMTQNSCDANAPAWSRPVARRTPSSSWMQPESRPVRVSSMQPLAALRQRAVAVCAGASVRHGAEPVCGRTAGELSEFMPHRHPLSPALRAGYGACPVAPLDRERGAIRL